MAAPSQNVWKNTATRYKLKENFSSKLQKNTLLAVMVWWIEALYLFSIFRAAVLRTVPAGYKRLPDTACTVQSSLSWALSNSENYCGDSNSKAFPVLHYFGKTLERESCTVTSQKTLRFLQSFLQKYGSAGFDTAVSLGTADSYREVEKNYLLWPDPKKVLGG